MYQEGVNDVVRYQDVNGKKEDPLISLQQYMKAFKIQHSSVTTPSNSGGKDTYIPSKRLIIDLKDKQAILANGVIPEKYKKYFEYQGLTQIKFNLATSTLTKDKMMVLEMISEISKSNWDRPIYFGATYGTATDLGLTRFLINEGMAYRLIPFEPRTKC